MSGSITFFAKQDCNGQENSETLLARVRAVARERNIKIPVRIKTFGAFGYWFRVSYTTNDMRDLILEIAKKQRLKPRK
jgi:hypothetical protein